MKGHRTLVFLGAAAVLLAASTAIAAPPLVDLQRDQRLDAKVDITAAKALPIATVFQELGKATGISLVAARLTAQDKLQPATDQPIARDLLAALADRYEGDWRLLGQTYVLGAPAGFEEVADLSPVRYREYEQEQWLRIIRGLRPKDWERLRADGLLDAADLSARLKEPVTRLAQLLCYRLDQPLLREMHPGQSLVRLVRQQKYCLGLVDDGRRLSVATYTKEPLAERSVEEFPLQ